MEIILPDLTNLNKTPAVYRIVFDDKWIYVGSSGGIGKRFRRWVFVLKTKKYLKQKNIQQILIGCKKIVFEIIDVAASKSIALDKENALLHSLSEYEYLLNRCPLAHTNKGIKPYFGQVKKEKPKTTPIGDIYKKVVKFDEQWNRVEIYPTINKAANSVSVSRKTLIKHFKGFGKRVKGFYFRKVDSNGNIIHPPIRQRKKIELTEFQKNKFSERSRNIIIDRIKSGTYESAFTKRSMKVIQFDLNGNRIREYSSINEAARNINGSSKNICQILSGKRKSTKGFTFKRA